ncbi:HAD superfamily, subfamily IIIB (Acid phosphatase) [Actinobaculum suis]|uniref:HAD superfamily, subfamily IIIB (Acid phosphatase) n=2 Tax=Actinobaculum suis TaxID=1657 RepID=A0A1G6ZKS4_9ACTO|nr:HAD superfamily, subfamily IIIB (Acid phosphatase) [Actinobaculum suis]
MVPSYCVKDLVQSGPLLLGMILLAVVLIAVGLAVRGRRRTAVAASAACLLALLPFTGPDANASANAPQRDCPAGYHYDASKAHKAAGKAPASKPAGPAKSQPAAAPGTDAKAPNNGPVAGGGETGGQTDVQAGAQTDNPAGKPVGGQTGKEGDSPQQPGANPAPATPVDRPAADESWMSVPRTYTLQADGSSGKTLAGDEILNWDIMKKTVRAYYGAGADGVANKTSSPYISEMTALTAQKTPEIAAACKAAVNAGERPAVVLDTDDTTLWTYDMEDSYMHFFFSQAKQDAYFAEHMLPATPGMVQLVQEVRASGCEIIGLTGRKDNEKAHTLENLRVAGYVDAAGNPLFTPDLFFTKFVVGAPLPDYLVAQGRCDTKAGKCTTVQYKAGTREYLRDERGYRIVANIGDQWSDLQGGRADSWIKLPNPSYYLPSPNLDAESKAHDDAAGMDPATVTYTVAADGSTGKAAGVRGDSIPNVDVVKATIRQYYAAHRDDTGKMVANREDSPYIRETKAKHAAAAQDVRGKCAAAAARGEKPAIVLDMDDTALWMYDMEETMEFNFSPAFQEQYLKTDYHSMPAVPGMVDVVQEARAGGCDFIGLTGRSEDYRDVTLRNLSEAGYPAPTQLFLKASSKREKLPSYVSCEKEKCTTVEFKSSTRRHLENDLGYRIVANFGDQYSDLRGGYADSAYKIPNPTYYLP